MSFLFYVVGVVYASLPLYMLESATHLTLNDRERMEWLNMITQIPYIYLILGKVSNVIESDV